MVKIHEIINDLIYFAIQFSEHARAVGIDYEGFVKVVCVFGTMNKEQILKLCYSLYDPEQVTWECGAKVCSSTRLFAGSLLSSIFTSERRNFQKTISGSDSRAPSQRHLGRWQSEEMS